MFADNSLLSVTQSVRPNYYRAGVFCPGGGLLPHIMGCGRGSNLRELMTGDLCSTFRNIDHKLLSLLSSNVM